SWKDTSTSSLPRLKRRFMGRAGLSPTDQSCSNRPECILTLLEFHGWVGVAPQGPLGKGRYGYERIQLFKNRRCSRDKIGTGICITASVRRYSLCNQSRRQRRGHIARPHCCCAAG